MADMDSSLKRLKFKVFVRLRPTDLAAKNGIVKPEHRLLYISDPEKENYSSEFVFDRVFGGDASQEEVFEEAVQPLVAHALAGYNACCFAYGQTGSGKTYSMFGKEGSIISEVERGAIPRAAELLFKAAELQQSKSVRLSFFVSFLEIYLEQVRDLGFAAQQNLLATAAGEGTGRKTSSSAGGPQVDKSNLEIWEDPSGTTTVKDLTYVEVTKVEDVIALLKSGYGMRQTASTNQNDVSSRSHTVFTISIVQFRDGQQPITGRLNLVDLAGSERLSKSHSEGQRLNEAKYINKSLTALGKVVMTLAQEGDKPHVPFRDSKLTRILKDSLQGNSYTTLLANLNPTPENYEECFNTLQFAVRCQSISTAPHVNVLTAGNGAGDVMIEQLMQQVAQLKEELEYTHAHYQKMIESVAGPGWAADMGPLERSEMEGEGSEMEGEKQGEAGRLRVAFTGASMSEERRNSYGQLGEASSHMGSRRVSMMGSSSLGGRTIAALESRIRRLEAQLDIQRDKTQQMDDRLHAKKHEYDEYRDRMTGKEHSQFLEIKKLRQQLADLKKALMDQQSQDASQLAEVRKRYEEEQARLQRDADALRHQLSLVTGSISSMMETRSHKAVQERRAKEAARAETGRLVQEQVALTAAEKERQIENLKQQSTYLLGCKQEELGSLRAELAKLQAQSSAEIKALQVESEYILAYAEKVTEALRRMEAGIYPVTEKWGLRAYKVPLRDKPAAIDPTRLQYLKSRSEAAQRLLTASLAVAAAGTLPAGMGSSAAETEDGRPKVQGPAHTHQGSSSLGLALSGWTDAPANGSASAVDLDKLKQQWEAEMKAQIASQVASEMCSDKTIEYIRTLESQLARARQELQQEKRRGNEMQVALRSAQRAQSRPQSAMQRALASSSSSMMHQPAKWGLGHGPASVHSRSRPATASPSLCSSSWCATPSRPGTSTSMHFITSTFT